jgi:hypothetical protein
MLTYSTGKTHRRTRRLTADLKEVVARKEKLLEALQHGRAVVREARSLIPTSTYADLCCRLLTYAVVREARSLTPTFTYADVCCRLLTYAVVREATSPIPTFTYADVC